MRYLQTDDGLNQTEFTDSLGRVGYKLDLTEAINTEAVGTSLYTRYTFSFQYENVSGSGSLKPQVSYDGINWIDDTDTSDVAISFTTDSNRIDTLTYIGTTKGEQLRFIINGSNTAGTVIIIQGAS